MTKSKLFLAAAAVSIATPAAAVEMLSFLIDGDTFDQPYSFANSSDAGEMIISFGLDLSTAPIGLQFDPVACPGGSTGTDFAPNGGTDLTTGLVANPVVPCNSQSFQIFFTDFDAGEFFSFDIDVDEIGGGVTVTGDELIGATVFADFSSGIRLSGAIFAVDGNPDAGQFVATGRAPIPTPAPGALGLAGLGLLGLAALRRRQRA